MAGQLAGMEMHTPEQGYSLPTGQGTSHSGVQEVFYWVYIKKGFGKGKKRLPCLIIF